MKRAFDLVFSSVILLLFLPFGIIISLLILASSKGPVFYFQTRVGKGNLDFKLFKFRTMRPFTDQFGKLTVGKRDPRITGIGYFLRKFKLDEFPQFINVLKGDMSVVGPRPEVREYVNYYSSEQLQVLNVRPGITDYASLKYFDENELLGASENPEKTYIEEIMPEKLKWNQVYIQNPSLINDFKIIGLTIKKIFRI
ncbi:MAG: sugar transferase [Bacteroidetes bacterium]|nr:sugar transferase [Bacteroidota bacterium]